MPLIALPAAALSALHEEAASGKRVNAAQLIQRLSIRGAITGFVLPAAFSVKTMSALLYTDRFFAHWDNRCGEYAAVRSPRSPCAHHGVCPVTLSARPMRGVTRAVLPPWLARCPYLQCVCDAPPSVHAGASTQRITESRSASHRWRRDSPAVSYTHLTLPTKA